MGIKSPNDKEVAIVKKKFTRVLENQIWFHYKDPHSFWLTGLKIAPFCLLECLERADVCVFRVREIDACRAIIQK